MDEKVLRELDGYEDIVEEIKISRKFGFDYSVAGDEVDRYVNRLHPPKLDLVVTRIIDETEDAKTLRFAAKDGYLPPFQAGQYITLVVHTGNVITTRPYSISSSPDQTAYYDITVRRVKDGMVSEYLLDRLKPGDELESSAPAGDFVYNPVIHSKEQVFIAGGSGVTPFVSMMRQVADRRLDRTIHLFYGNSSDNNILFHDELMNISSACDNINYYPVIESPAGAVACETGLITADLIKSKVDDISGKTFYMCGPTAMYDFCGEQLGNLSIPQKQVRTEMYGMPYDITAYPGWPSEVAGDKEFTFNVEGQKSFTGKASDSILKTLELNGLRVPSLCRSGECSLCRVKLVSGQVFQPEGVLLRKSDVKYGYIHSCAAFPLSNIELLL